MPALATIHSGFPRVDAGEPDRNTLLRIVAAAIVMLAVPEAVVVVTLRDSVL